MRRYFIALFTVCLVSQPGFHRGYADADAKPGVHGILQHQKKKMKAAGKENRIMKNINMSVS